MNDDKAGSHIEKAIFEASYFSKIRVVGHQKMMNSRVAACFAVAGVQICLLDANKISSPNI
tara:strand:+ start:459 stop:641 length:183 start_codon:yes stop_codon:yes gene_type:complete